MIIDQLPLLATAQTTDEMPIERGVTTYKVAVEDILAVANSDTTSPKDGTAAIGSSTKFARQDHRHPLNVATSGTPEMDGTASLGSATDYARTDHVHPVDTSRASASDLTALSGGFKAFTVTLLAASWSSDAQTVSNANFIASGYAYIVSPASASFADYGAAQIYADDVTTDGSMTFHCASAPSTDLTVNIARMVAS